MKNEIISLSFASLFLFPVVAQSNVTRGEMTTQIFKNANCAATDSCDLKEFKLRKYDYKVSTSEGISHGSGAFTSFKTDKTENLEKYAVVQFMRGCTYIDALDEQGNSAKRFNFVKESFGEITLFKYPNWIIDSLDKDPIYSSYSATARHGFNRWNKVENSINHETEAYFVNEKPTRPELYVRDFPGVAFVGPFGPKNISYEFRTCLYKTSEVPQETRADDLNFADPIHCFEWQSSFIYNHQTKKYETKPDLDSACLEPLPSPVVVDAPAQEAPAQEAPVQEAPTNSKETTLPN